MRAPCAHVFPETLGGQRHFILPIGLSMLGLSVSGRHPHEVGGGVTPSIVLSYTIGDTKSGVVRLVRKPYSLQPCGHGPRYDYE